MEHNASWEVNSHSASQDILRLICNVKDQYLVHISSPQNPVLKQMNSVHNLRNYFSKIYFNIILPSTPSSFEWSLPFIPSDETSICISHIFHACYMLRPSHPPWFDHLIIFDEAYNLWSSSLCSLPSLSPVL